MPYNRPHIYVTFGGDLGSSAPSDIWQCGLRFTSDGTLPAVLPTFSTSNVYDALGDMIGDPDLKIGNGAILRWVKIAHLDEEGEYMEEPQIFEVDNANKVAGGVVQGAASWQDSMVVSLRSGQNFGKANFGRIYLPCWAAQVSSTTGYTDNNGAVELVRLGLYNVQGILNITLIGEGEAPVGLSIMSSVGTGTTKRVQTVAVGNVKDTQRRRRNGLVETYDVVPLN